MSVQLLLMAGISHYAQAAAVEAVASSTEHATDSQPTATFDAISVYANSYRTTGTKTNLNPQDSPMSYERIDQQVLQSRQADSVNAALRYDPSITSESRGTTTLFDEYNIRGFKTYSNFYDGMRLAYDGFWNLTPQVDVYATEAVEVVKGPASSLYGYASPGGLVNQIAKTPSSQEAHELKVRVGNQDLKEVATDHTGAVTDTLNYRLVALARKKEGQMQTTKEERIMINPSLQWQPNDKVSVIANMFYQDDPHMLPSTPLHSVGTLYNSSYGKLDSDAYAGDVWANYRKKVWMPSLTTNWDIKDNLQFKNVIRYTDAKGKQRNIYNRGLVEDTDNLLIRAAYTTDEEMTNFTTDNQLAYQFNSGDVSHNLLLGAEYQTTDSKALYKDAGAAGTPLLDMSHPDYHLVNPETLPLDNYIETADIKQKQLGLYLQDEIQWKDLTVVAGLRHDDFDSNNHKVADGVASTVNNKAKKTSGRLSAIYNLDNGFSPYLSYSESFEPVVGSNFITGEAFEPTTADQIEIGVKYLSADSKTKATLAAYDITKNNVVVSDYVNYRNQTQTGEITSKGFEVSGSRKVNDWMDLSVGYGFTDAEISEDDINPQYVGNTPEQVAKHKATLWSTFYPTDKIMLNTGVRYQQGMQVDRENSDELPSVTLVDIGGSYQLNDRWRIEANISNLFDKTYVGSCYDKANCWMGPERQMSLSATAKF
ncbi:TonB-dependent siderophore receptor [Psychrobacter sp. YP14]|uniref:TonB-dependent siderophore receptor n=1 Tax=Psychrobacter sp. YP14 TaxID=2203895 RepID=UPI001D0DBF35|nr:TonB-dependent siderophore receptor [Psychrobacter sp. YP14]